jgi:hypothetical protein
VTVFPATKLPIAVATVPDEVPITWCEVWPVAAETAKVPAVRIP